MTGPRSQGWFWLLIFTLSVAPLACNFPETSATPDPLPTYVAQTVEARLTAAAVSAVPATSAGGDTADSTEAPASGTPTSTNTPLPPTETSIPCDSASFVSDVTIPDGEVLSPDESFTKTWRLKNAGTCIWNSRYALVFDHGDAMDGPQALDFPSGDVNPGETVDLSVDLRAPSSPGSYTGYWKLRSEDGRLFGVGRTGDVAFWVEIEVASD
jgi:hypothetical protein